MIRELRDRVERAVACSEADFAEIRLSLHDETTFVQAGITAENNGPVGRFSGTARVFIGNRWGICEFSGIDSMQYALDRAAAHAIHSQSPPLPFPMLAPECRDSWNDSLHAPSLQDTPGREKAFLCRHYCELMGATLGAGSARVSYHERAGDRIIVNSRGTSVHERENLGSMKFQAVLPGGLCNTREIAVRGGFEPFKGLEKEIEHLGRDLVMRDTTSNIAPGESRVVVDQELAGVIIHEAFGHLIEADFLEYNPAVAHTLRPGQKIASSLVNIVDDSRMMRHPGSMRWDDEGSPGERTVLVENGVVKSWLHTAETAAGYGTNPTGNARSADPGRMPEARMTCTFFQEGSSSKEELLEELDNGLYLKGFSGGATDMDRFSISVQEVWTVRKGRLHKPVTPVVISGRMTDVLHSVQGTGNDLKLSGVLRGCARRGGRAIPVSHGGPHLLIGRIQVS